MLHMWLDVILLMRAGAPHMKRMMLERGIGG